MRSFTSLSVLLLLALPLRAEVVLRAEGSLSAAPLMETWLADYQALRPELKTSYEGGDALEGMRKWMKRKTDLLVLDVPMREVERRRVPGRKVLEVPVALQALALTYNLPGVPDGLKLSKGAVSGMFHGSLGNWRNGEVARANPGLDLPSLEVVPVRLEATTSDHDLLPAFLEEFGRGWAFRDGRLVWPKPRPVEGNGDVEALLRKVPGVIAVVDLPYALKRGLPRAALLNQVDRYVVPSVEALKETASDFQSLPEDFRVNLWASREPGAYLLSGFVWFVLEVGSTEPEKEKALLALLEWILTEGQKSVEAAGYAPLPERFREQVLKSVRNSR